MKLNWVDVAGISGLTLIILGIVLQISHMIPETITLLEGMAWALKHSFDWVMLGYPISLILLGFLIFILAIAWDELDRKYEIFGLAAFFMFMATMMSMIFMAPASGLDSEVVMPVISSMANTILLFILLLAIGFLINIVKGTKKKYWRVDS